MKEAIVEKDLDHFSQVAVSLAQEGGKILRQYWGNLHEITEKDGVGNLVTEADKASEKRILEMLGTTFPDHAILAEESGEHKAQNSPFLWAVDPLDGTTNYAHQLPIFSVSIALLYNKKPIVGVVFNPILQELFTAQKGGGAFLNGKKIRVSETKRLDKSLLATGFPYFRREETDNNYREFNHLTSITQGVRRLGSAAIDMAYVAAGRLDGYWEKGIWPWDVAAGALLVSEAGGTVTGYGGEEADLFSHQILATNGGIHQLLMNELLP